GDIRRVLLDGNQRQDFVHEGLAIRSPGRIGHLHTDEQLGHRDRRNGHVIGVDLIPGVCHLWYAAMQAVCILPIVRVAFITRSPALRAAFPKKR
ncbi:hypothetical protein SAMN05421874_1631, partial [Nonomuraea maritima]